MLDWSQQNWLPECHPAKLILAAIAPRRATNGYFTHPSQKGPQGAAVLAGRDGEVGVEVRHKVGGLRDLVDDDEGVAAGHRGGDRGDSCQQQE